MKLETRKTEWGFVIDSPIIARTGIQLYKRDGKWIKEYRPPEEVFAKESLVTFEGAPITITHPSLPVSSKNASGQVVGAILGTPWRDGDYLRANVVLHDQKAIDLVESGKMQELSVGYSLNTTGSGMTPDGIKYDAKQINIRCNHLAIVSKGRAGVAKFTTTEFKQMNIENLDRMDEVVSNVVVVEPEDAPKVEVRAEPAETVSEEPSVEDVVSAIAEPVPEINLDEMNATIDQLRNDLEEAKRINESVLVQMRADIEADVRKQIEREYDVREQAKYHGINFTSTEATMKAIINKCLPTMKLDGLDDNSLETVYQTTKHIKLQTLRNTPVQQTKPAVTNAFQYLGKA